jgi:DNA-binding CsgD family transcriptional regulator
MEVRCPKCGVAMGVGFRGHKNPAWNLTEREADCADLAMRGFSNARIAQRLGITEQVVKNYLAAVYTQIGVRNRAELVIVGLLGRDGLKQLQEEVK